MTENKEKIFSLEKGNIKTESVYSIGTNINASYFAVGSIYLESESYKKKTFLHRIRTLGILIFLAIFTGSGLGLWYYNTMLRSNVDYETLFAQADTYLTDYNTTFANTLSIDTPSDKSWVEDAKNRNITPASLSAVDNFALAEWNAANSASFSSIGTGVVATSVGVNQDVYSEKKFDGNTYSFINISNGMIPVLSLDYYQKNSNKISIYSGKNTKDGVACNYDRDMLYEEYKDYVGTPITNILPYIVSNKTVLTQSEVVLDQMSGNYTFTLELNSVLSIIKYAKQVKKTGGLANYPEFSSIVLEVAISNSWNFVKVNIVEKYSAVAFGMKVGCTATMAVDYTFDENVTLPV